MANPSYVPFTLGDGSGKTATYRINEGGFDKDIQRFTTNTAEGEDVALGSCATPLVTIQRPNDAVAYVNNDVWAATTPTVGGSQFSDCARLAGKSGLITDLLAFSNVTSTMQAELWLFDEPVTAIADNAAFSLSIVDLRKLVATIPFTLAAAGGGPSWAQVDGINKMFTAGSTPHLFGLVKLKGGYTPSANEQLTLKMKVMRSS